MLDVIFGTKNRDTYTAVLRNLAEQSIASTLSVYILDGNFTSAVEEAVNATVWPFARIVVIKEPLALLGRSPSWPAMYNFLAKQGSNDFLTYWSDDLEFQPADGFARALAACAHPEAGAAAFAVAHDTRSPIEMHRSSFGFPLYVGLIRRTAFDAVGGLDEGFKFWYADMDFSRRLLAAGYRIDPVPHCRVRNVREGWGNPLRQNTEDRELYRARWGDNACADV